ncbi:DUF3515 domain-containing protein [Nesterenkonia populi]|uniref:DUF3515 domain-containing protein n=1 Tax=Nesterenkonia populi TaxID=1591087 RepID=UPI0011BDC479|nr:DUF3515 domain-containing protein [Nesterenkonia populi]
MPKNPRLSPRTHRTTTTAGTLFAVMLGASACASTASVEPAPEAHDPVCAEVMLQLPEDLGESTQRPTDSQGTSAWGDPSDVVLRCGVEPIGATDEPCQRIDGVDWVFLEQQDHYQAVTFGREPAVEVLLGLEAVSSATAMPALSPAVAEIDQTRECLDYEQTLDGEDLDPEPALPEGQNE